MWRQKRRSPITPLSKETTQKWAISKRNAIIGALKLHEVLTPTEPGPSQWMNGRWPALSIAVCMWRVCSSIYTLDLNSSWVTIEVGTMTTTVVMSIPLVSAQCPRRGVRLAGWRSTNSCVRAGTEEVELVFSSKAMPDARGYQDQEARMDASLI